MFNPFLDFSGHDMATDAGRRTMYRRNFKAQSLQTKGTKNEGPSKNLGFEGKRFEDCRLIKYTSSVDQWTKKKHTAVKYYDCRWPL